jgi:hypothetical protein
MCPQCFLHEALSIYNTSQLRCVLGLIHNINIIEGPVEDYDVDET